MDTDERLSTVILLDRYRKGDKSAETELFDRVYNELYRLASYYMRGESAGHLLQPSALINEAYMQLCDQREKELADRHHFVALAATVMRRILVNYSRRDGTEKRNFGIPPEPISERLAIASPEPDPQGIENDLVRLDAALTRLSGIDPLEARVVELRFFGGLSIEQTAAVLGISASSVKREWAHARAWLAGELAAER
jgi:RNA polymerase sigma factor (TIGR02999 family)